jgi:hypothetical protein
MNSKVKVRRFTEPGIEKFRQTLADARQQAITELPEHLVDDESISEEIPGLYVERKQFLSKLNAGRYFADLVAEIRRKSLSKKIYSDVGLWSWLGAFYFDQICPKDRDGNLKLGKEDTPYILTSNFWKFHRHRLAALARIYEVHQESCKLLFAEKLHIEGEFIEQLMSYQEVFMNPRLLKAAEALYWDQENSIPRPGAKNRKKRGNVRRFVAVALQFDLTYDMHSMKIKDIVDILPQEFDKFRVPSTS